MSLIKYLEIQLFSFVLYKQSEVQVTSDLTISMLLKANILWNTLTYVVKITKKMNHTSLKRDDVKGFK